MNYLLYFLQIIIIQYATAQVFTAGGNNFIPNMNNPTGSNRPIGANVAKSYGLGNGIGSGNIGQTNALELSNAQNNLNVAGINGNANLAQAIANSNNAANINANLGQVDNANNNIANIEIANANVPCNKGNVATVAKYATVVKPPREYGMEFSSDDLQVRGGVSVTGKMPFNANVEIKGSMPASGQGKVTYKCDKISADAS